MNILHYTLNFVPRKTKKVFYNISKEHLEFSKIAKFDREMQLTNAKNIASQTLRICIEMYITHGKAHNFRANFG